VNAKKLGQAEVASTARRVPTDTREGRDRPQTTARSLGNAPCRRSDARADQSLASDLRAETRLPPNLPWRAAPGVRIWDHKQSGRGQPSPASQDPNRPPLRWPAPVRVVAGSRAGRRRSGTLGAPNHHRGRHRRPTRRTCAARAPPRHRQQGLPPGHQDPPSAPRGHTHSQGRRRLPIDPAIPHYATRPPYKLAADHPHNWRHRVWQPVLELAGLDRRGPYQLRHTFAYFSLRAGVPISDLSVEMGHESIRLTHETYGHWSDEMGDRAANLREAWANGDAG
jgi:hypothetical protein